jgi:Ion channel
MRTIELMLGGIIVVSTLVDIFQSVVVPRPTRRALRLAPFLIDGIWPLWKWIALRFPSAKHRAAFLGIYAPLTVVMLLLVWGIALIFGYGLLFIALKSELQPRPNDLGTALYFAGTSMLTLGFGDIVATGGITRILALCAGASGIAIMSGVISMFFSLYSSLGHREVLVTMLHNRAGSPPSGVTLLETYARLKMLEELPGFLTAWEEWSTEVLIGSLSYPVLPYFRSVRPSESWISALGALLDTATLIISCIEDGPAGPAKLLYKSGCQLVNDLKDYFKISPAQALAGTPTVCFEEAYSRLKSAGFCLADPEPALASFIQLRSAYTEALHGLMQYWVVSQRKF